MKLPAFSSRALVIASLAAGISIGALGTAAVARQPNMEAAIDFLIRADQSLQRATDNKGGHKAKARQLIADAIFQVRQGIRAAN
jgi:malonyl CoA-acyl carrier protein transacylase